MITATFTGLRQTSLFPKAARAAAPRATYCYPAIGLPDGPRSLRAFACAPRCRRGNYPSSTSVNQGDSERECRRSCVPRTKFYLAAAIWIQRKTAIKTLGHRSIELLPEIEVPKMRRLPESKIQKSESQTDFGLPMQALGPKRQKLERKKRIWS